MAQRKGKTNTEADVVVEAQEISGNATQSWFSKITSEEFLEENQKTISYVTGAIALIALLYFGYKYLYIAPREKSAVAAIYKAETQFAQDSFALALENPGGGFEGFLDIINNYSGTKTANLAKYYAGICYLNLGKYQEAVDYLEDYSAKDEVTSITKAGALGDAYAELGNNDKALSHYKKAVSGKANDVLTPYYLNKLAMWHYAQGQEKEALEYFQKIKKDFPESQESREAEKYIERFQ
ncbi:MAG: tetratricopeptide repeat protein [Saprospiraceae bacterium]|nr:tetratricopeptide repeat protein [Saprospiraceae bacterium]